MLYLSPERLKRKEVSSVTTEIHNKAITLDELHKQLKEKLQVCRYSEKLQILTLMPDIRSRKKSSKDFNVSEYLVQIAQKLKLADSILVTPRKKFGKSLKPKAKQAVLDFYENDEYSQQMPGKKDYVSISSQTHKQKRLLLCNLEELYQEFKVKNPSIGIGFMAKTVCCYWSLRDTFCRCFQYSPECYSLMQCIRIKNYMQIYHQYDSV